MIKDGQISPLCFFKITSWMLFGSSNFDFGVGTYDSRQLFGWIQSNDGPLLCSFKLTIFIKCNDT